MVERRRTCRYLYSRPFLSGFNNICRLLKHSLRPNKDLSLLSVSLHFFLFWHCFDVLTLYQHLIKIYRYRFKFFDKSCVYFDIVSRLTIFTDFLLYLSSFLLKNRRFDIVCYLTIFTNLFFNILTTWVLNWWKLFEDNFDIVCCLTTLIF